MCTVLLFPRPLFENFSDVQIHILFVLGQDSPLPPAQSSQEKQGVAPTGISAQQLDSLDASFFSEYLKKIETGCEFEFLTKWENNSHHPSFWA